ncbi:hypothetical protein LX36DRAFT_348083 [Colletotrichum falcatum]|nr:hypothetical protein LX36DRAFT_348083 [Colletotrichum falcatum]
MAPIRCPLLLLAYLLTCLLGRPTASRLTLTDSYHEPPGIITIMSPFPPFVSYPTRHLFTRPIVPPPFFFLPFFLLLSVCPPLRLGSSIHHSTPDDAAPCLIYPITTPPAEPSPCHPMLPTLQSSPSMVFPPVASCTDPPLKAAHVGPARPLISYVVSQISPHVATYSADALHSLNPKANQSTLQAGLHSQKHI